MVSFRKDRKTRTWTVIGPASQVQIGPVQANRRDGTVSTVQVASVSRVFDSKGVPTRFGYLANQRWKYSKNADLRPSEGAGNPAAPGPEIMRAYPDLDPRFTDGLYSS